MKLFILLLLLQAAVGLAAAGANQTFSDPIIPANPEAAGKALVAKLLSLRPTESLTNRATLTTYSNRTELGSVPLVIEVTAGDTQWTTTYIVAGKGSTGERLIVAKANDGSTTYHAKRCAEPQKSLVGQAAFTPIAGSDFTLADVGMEFLHWPTQRLLKKEVRRTQACDKLESVAPSGWAGEYVRVLSWFDIDTGGPVVVEAYNAKGKLVKEFRPTKFEKVDGQYRVEEIEMNSISAKTRSSIRFDLKSSAP